jgi:hypothetical protein
MQRQGGRIRHEKRARRMRQHEEQEGDSLRKSLHSTGEEESEIESVNRACDDCDICLDCRCDCVICYLAFVVSVSVIWNVSASGIASSCVVRFGCCVCPCHDLCFGCGCDWSSGCDGAIWRRQL